MSVDYRAVVKDTARVDQHRHNPKEPISIVQGVLEHCHREHDILEHLLGEG